MRWTVAALMAATLAGCGKADEPTTTPPTPPPGMAKPPADPPAEPPAQAPPKTGEKPPAETASPLKKLMKSNESEYKLALEEAEAGGKADSVKARLETIRKNLAEFRKTWKPGDPDTAEIMMDLFLGTLDQVVAGDLGGPDAGKRVGRLQVRCDTCHQNLRDK